MPATAVSSNLTGNPILDAIDGGERWDGVITYNFVNPASLAERNAFYDALPDAYQTGHLGLTAPMMTGLDNALRLVGKYAVVTYAYTDDLAANYLVSDFSKPGSPNTAGIAARPGNGQTLAFNVQSWDGYTSEQQSWILLHEAAHTLGLRHPDGLPPELQFAQYTMMAYDWYTLGDEANGLGLPLTPMALDVAVLQANYGAAPSNTGRTWYELSRAGDRWVDLDGSNPNGDTIDHGAGYVCIWDTGGDDTLVAPTGDWYALGALVNLNAATLTTTAYTGALAEVIGEVAQTSRIFAGLSSLAKAEITDPVRTAGGFFSSDLLANGERHGSGYTIANGVTIEHARGDGGDDLLIGNAAANSIWGGDGKDEIYGGAGDDSLQGSRGDDRVFGGTGNDVIDDEDGSNFLRGGEGDDSMTGSWDRFDDMHGNQGNDTLHGGGGGDWVVGGKDNDALFGDDGGDIVWGNLGADTCEGGVGNDQVRGGQADDVLRGGAGDDWLSGDRGSDTITGGTGADIFHSFSDAGVDRVLDFSAAEDDRVMLDPGTAYTVAQVGADTVVSMTGGGEMILVGVRMDQLSAGWIFET